MSEQNSKRNIQKTALVYIVYETLRAEKGLRKAIVDVFSTRKKASDFVKGNKGYLIAEWKVK